jgi:CheY-like chemotaxis protein
VPVRTIGEARRSLRSELPRAIVLDILLEGEETWRFLAELKGDETTRGVPILVVTTVDDARKGLSLGADAYTVKPTERDWLLSTLHRLTRPSARKALVIDDDAIARYLLKRVLSGLGYTVMEAPNGPDGLRIARQDHPDAIFLDLVMPELSGHEVLARLKNDPVCADIPVMIVTSKVLGEAERDALLVDAVAVLAKDGGSEEVRLASLRTALAQAGVGLR